MSGLETSIMKHAVLCKAILSLEGCNLSYLEVKNCILRLHYLYSLLNKLNLKLLFYVYYKLTPLISCLCLWNTAVWQLRRLT